MQTITKETEILQPTPDEAIEYLQSEYIRNDGKSTLELIYIDYRDQYEDMDTLQTVLKDGYSDQGDQWQWDAQDESIREIEQNFIKSIDNPDDKEIELTDEVRDTIREWCQDHDESTPTEDLLKNTGSILCYIETPDTYTNDGYSGENLDNEAIIEKYATTDEQKKEIESTFTESFYSAPVSFYFYASALELYNAIHTAEKDEDYIVIDGAYFSTVDRSCGSNWLGNKGIFKIAVVRDKFIENLFLDGAKGNGYGWGSIAGQSNYDDAGVYAQTVSHVQQDAIHEKLIIIDPEVSDAQKREKELQDHWDKTKTCTPGDMKWSRHKGKKEYSNNFPCGSTCETCGTFWID